MSTHSLLLAKNAWSIVIRLSQATNEYVTPARDAWSMIFRLRQAPNEYAPHSLIKGRVGNGHSTKVSKNEYAHYPCRKGRVVNCHTTKVRNK